MRPVQRWTSPTWRHFVRRQTSYAPIPDQAGPAGWQRNDDGVAEILIENAVRRAGGVCWYLLGSTDIATSGARHTPTRESELERIVRGASTRLI